MSKETTAILKKVEQGSATPAELGAILKDLKFDENLEVTSEYLKFEIGEEIRVWFVEMATIKKLEGNDGEVTGAVRLITEDGTRCINADAVVVSTCKQFKKGTPLVIQCTGEAGPKGRTYKTFKIYELPM